MCYCLDGTPLQRAEHTKHLGLWLDSELSFKCHIDDIVKKLNLSINSVFFTYPETAFHLLLERGLCYNQGRKIMVATMAMALHCCPSLWLWYLENHFRPYMVFVPLLLSKSQGCFESAIGLCHSPAGRQPQRWHIIFYTHTLRKGGYDAIVRWTFFKIMGRGHICAHTNYLHPSIQSFIFLVI